MDIVQRRTDKTKLAAIMKRSLIKATDKFKTPPQIIWVGQSAIATLGNFSASIGKAKAKKTFNVSAIVAASLANKTVLNYRAELPEGKRRILYVDTEQSRFHCHNVLERILKLADLPTDSDCEMLDFLCLREYDPDIRMETIDYTLEENEGYGLVVIDGIRDLLLDINSATESVTVINTMMAWSSRYDLHIHCVLHQNKSDSNSRGHIGTEMNNKAEAVLVVAKHPKDSNISEVSAMHIRDKDFAPFAFTIDENGLPVSCDRPASDVGSASKQTFNKVPDEIHHEALRLIFSKRQLSGYDGLIKSMQVEYELRSLAHGRTMMVDFLSVLMKKKVVVKKKREYILNEELMMSVSLKDED